MLALEGLLTLSVATQSTAFNVAGILVARVGLGVFEAGFGPGLPLYMCKSGPCRHIAPPVLIHSLAAYYYTKEEMGMRMAYWFGFAAVAGAFGGLIAFGIQHAHTAVSDWRLLFIVEGIPTVLLGVLTLFLLPNRPEETSFLNEKEREIALERANRGTKADTGRTITKGTYRYCTASRRSISYAFNRTYPRSTQRLAGMHNTFIGLQSCIHQFLCQIYASGVLYFGANCALASISAFLPTIIATFGYSMLFLLPLYNYLPVVLPANALAQLLTVPPYAVAAVFLCINSYASDRLQSRGIFIAAVSALAGVGYV